MKNNIRKYEEFTPIVQDQVYIDAMSVVIGDAHLAKDVSVWPCAVIRADVNTIEIGEGSNIQDHCMLHVSHKTQNQPLGNPLKIGKWVTVGHHVNLHGCEIGDEVLIGMGSIVLDRAVIENRVLIGAGSLVPSGKRLESGYLYLGNPVKQVRALTEDELAYFEYSAKHYIKVKNNYLKLEHTSA